MSEESTSGRRTTNPAAVPPDSAGHKHVFGALKQIDAGVLNVRYAEAGPATGPAVILLHGWPYDIHSYVDVAPMLAAAGATGSSSRICAAMARRAFFHVYNMRMGPTPELIAWLLDGDPAIRWQTMRDLQRAPADCWQAEQRRTLSEGWGMQLLALQAPNGSWGNGIYSPKWISTTYTLLTLRDIGIPPDHAPGQRAAALVLDKQLGRIRDDAFMRGLAACDRCIVGMDLSIAAYFSIRDERVDAIVENLLMEMLPDGAWNCRRQRRPEPHHSSFHTTFNVLEGLRDWLEVTPRHPLHNDVLHAEKSALEFMLEHRLFKSDKTGKTIDSKFTMLSYPHRWYYDVLRGLAYFARANAPHDERLQDAIELLRSRRRTDGTWPVQNKHPGKVFFEMEQVGRPSRWNTLRALRVLQWWEG